MPAYKAVPIILILGLVTLTGIFYFMEDMRPPFIQRMFLSAAGFGPAKNPSEALDRFKDAIRKRNYKAAATFCTGEYADELDRSAKKAMQLGNAVDDLLHNMKEVAGITSEKGEFALLHLYPFPRDFKVDDLKHKDGAEEAYAVLLLDDGKRFSIDDVVRATSEYKMDPKIIWSVTPRPWNGAVTLKLVGDKQKSWKIEMPVSPFLRDSMLYLREKGGNYARALENIKYAIKHEAATKANFESQLRNELADAR